MNKSTILKVSALMFSALVFLGTPSKASNVNIEIEKSAGIAEEVSPSNWLNLTSMCSDEPSVSRRWRVRNITDAPVEFTWEVYGTSQNGAGVAPVGDSYFFTDAMSGPNTTKIYWVVEGITYNKVKASGGAQCEVVVPPTPCGANLLVNGDFEAGNTGFTSEYTYKVDGPSNNELVPELTYGVGPNSATYHPAFEGMGRSGKFMIVNGNEDFIRTVWSQTVNVISGKDYEFAIYVSNLYQSEPANLRFMAGTDQIGTFTPVIDGVSQWFSYSAIYTATTTGSVEIKIFTDNLTLQYGNDFGLDDISFKEICPSVEPQSCVAIEVIDFNQKKRNDGSTIDIERSNPSKALGLPEDDQTNNFVSLGFGGDITLKFGSPIKNGEGDDVRVIESTFGSGSGNCARYPERIRAFASQDGCNWVYLGEDCQDADFDLGSLAWAQFIKLVDVSPVGATYQGTPIADAYDLDGVICLNGYEENAVPADLMIGAASEVISFDQMSQKNGGSVAAARSNPENATGMPQGGDVVNFVALGFGGEIVLKFDYVIFDTQDAADFRVVETSYGNPICEQYPERALVSVKLDLADEWIDLGEICLDGDMDLNGMFAAQFIKIKDRSAMSNFSNSADGYDVDGVVSLNNCGNVNEDTRIADNTATQDEVTSISASPNPFKSDLRLDIATSNSDNTALIGVYNFLGQQVFSSRVNVASSSNVSEVLNLGDLKTGVYFVTVETNTSKETIKLIKQ